jgi:hypothetical protein
MKPSKIIAIFFLIFLILQVGQRAVAQPPFSLPIRPPAKTDYKGHCLLDPSITFTEEQPEKFEALKGAYVTEAKPLWSELRALRLELRYAVSDPKVQSQVLFDKQRKISAIQAKLENLLFSYVIKARAIFTKEQLERFPSDCPLKMEVGYGMGTGFGKGTQKGIR